VTYRRNEKKLYIYADWGIALQKWPPNWAAAHNGWANGGEPIKLQAGPGYRRKVERPISTAGV
jgi:hypothetical protein